MNSMPATSAGLEAFGKEYEKRTKPIQNQIEVIKHTPEFTRGNPKIFNHYLRLVFEKYLYNEEDINKLTLNAPLTTAKNEENIEGLFNKELFGSNYDMRPQLTRLRVPTLVIHGEADPIPILTA